jgi:hypothetical protein
LSQVSTEAVRIIGSIIAVGSVFLGVMLSDFYSGWSRIYEYETTVPAFYDRVFTVDSVTPITSVEQYRIDVVTAQITTAPLKGETVIMHAITRVFYFHVTRYSKSVIDGHCYIDNAIHLLNT